MTRKTNARLAGFLLLFYIATGIAGLILFNQATGGVEGTAAKLASITQHATLVRLTIVLTLLTIFVAVVLAVALYALTRDEDPDLALLALTCRVGEGMINVIPAIAMLALLSVAMGAATAVAPDAAANALGALLLNVQGWSTTVAATLFAVGSTLYSYLFLRARSIPVPLARLGVFASILLVAVLPLQLAGFIHRPVTDFIWIPLLVFEVALALWLLIKGVAPPLAKNLSHGDGDRFDRELRM